MLEVLRKTKQEDLLTENDANKLEKFAFNLRQRYTRKISFDNFMKLYTLGAISPYEENRGGVPKTSLSIEISEDFLLSSFASIHIAYSLDTKRVELVDAHTRVNALLLMIKNGSFSKIKNQIIDLVIVPKEDRKKTYEGLNKNNTHKNNERANNKDYLVGHFRFKILKEANLINFSKKYTQVLMDVALAYEEQGNLIEYKHTRGARTKINQAVYLDKNSKENFISKNNITMISKALVKYNELREASKKDGIKTDTRLLVDTSGYFTLFMIDFLSNGINTGGFSRLPKKDILFAINTTTFAAAERFLKIRSITRKISSGQWDFVINDVKKILKY